MGNQEAIPIMVSRTNWDRMTPQKLSSGHCIGWYLIQLVGAPGAVRQWLGTRSFCSIHVRQTSSRACISFLFCAAAQNFHSNALWLKVLRAVWVLSLVLVWVRALLSLLVLVSAMVLVLVLALVLVLVLVCAAWRTSTPQVPLDCVVFFAILMCNDVDARADKVETPHFR